MKAKKTPKTLFGIQIRSNKKAHKLMVALNMVGLNVNIPACRLIIKAQESVRKMGGKFDLKTACKIQAENDDYFAKMQEQYESENNKVKYYEKK